MPRRCLGGQLAILSACGGVSEERMLLRPNLYPASSQGVVSRFGFYPINPSILVLEKQNRGLPTSCPSWVDGRGWGLRRRRRSGHGLWRRHIGCPALDEHRAVVRGLRARRRHLQVGVVRAHGDGARLLTGIEDDVTRRAVPLGFIHAIRLVAASDRDALQPVRGHDDARRSGLLVEEAAGERQRNQRERVSTHGIRRARNHENWNLDAPMGVERRDLSRGQASSWRFATPQKSAIRAVSMPRL